MAEKIWLNPNGRISLLEGLALTGDPSVVLAKLQECCCEEGSIGPCDATVCVYLWKAEYDCSVYPGSWVLISTQTYPVFSAAPAYFESYYGAPDEWHLTPDRYSSHTGCILPRDYCPEKIYAHYWTSVENDGAATGGCGETLPETPDVDLIDLDTADCSNCDCDCDKLKLTVTGTNEEADSYFDAGDLDAARMVRFCDSFDDTTPRRIVAILNEDGDPLIPQPTWSYNAGICGSGQMIAGGWIVTMPECLLDSGPWRVRWAVYWCDQWWDLPEESGVTKLTCPTICRREPGGVLNTVEQNTRTYWDTVTQYVCDTWWPTSIYTCTQFTSTFGENCLNGYTFFTSICIGGHIGTVFTNTWFIQDKEKLSNFGETIEGPCGGLYLRRGGSSFQIVNYRGTQRTSISGDVIPTDTNIYCVRGAGSTIAAKANVYDKVGWPWQEGQPSIPGWHTSYSGTSGGQPGFPCPPTDMLGCQSSGALGVNSCGIANMPTLNDYLIPDYFYSSVTLNGVTYKWEKDV
jgi:hypothetical protein